MPEIQKGGGDAQRGADEGRRFAEMEPSPDPFSRQVTRHDGQREEDANGGPLCDQGIARAVFIPSQFVICDL